MKTFLIITTKILYAIFCTICTLFITFHVCIILAHSQFTNNGFDFQIIFYTFLSLLLVGGLWSLLFIKIEPRLKILLFLLLILIQSNYLEISMLIPSVKKIIYMEVCIDTGICAQGLTMQDNKGNSIPINKENCIKYGWEWNDSNKTCKLKKQ